MKNTKFLTIFFAFLLLLSVTAYSAQSLKLTSPRGQENWKLGSTQKIMWTASDLEGTFRIVLLRKNQVVKILHSFKDSYKGYKMGSYEWKISKDEAAGEDYKIRIECQMDKGPISDESGSPFTLSGMTMRADMPDIPRIKVLDPNGGERVMKGSSFRIRWNSNRDCSTVNIYIIKNETDELYIYNMARARGPIGDGDWYWNWAVPTAFSGGIPFPDGDNYKIKVEAHGTSDKSDSNFTVTGKKIEVFSPRAGDVWYRTHNQMITFRATGISQNLKIWAAGSPAYPIAINVPPRETEHMWVNVGQIGDVIIGGTDRIYVETMDGTVQGESGRFSMREPTIGVTAPADGSRIPNESEIMIRWTSSHLNGNVNIVLYRAPSAGGVFSRVTPALASNISNSGTFAWRIRLAGDFRYRIRVESSVQGSVKGETGVFYIR